MLSILLWYLAITLLGWATFPLAYRLLPTLPDRGYAFSRTLGLLLWGYLFWLLASLGILPNSAGGLLFALSIVLGMSAFALFWRPDHDLVGFLRQRRITIIIVELLFLTAFAGWAYVRGTNPEAVGTEKPMELAFINAILNSSTFPPHDPWLSGYAISYYYFGYVMVAMLARLTSTSGAIAFNLGISLVFGLSAIGAYGLVYNLITIRKPQASKWSDGLGALLAPLFLLIVSNLEGFLHMLHNRGLFWQQDASGQMVSPFWSWLDIIDLRSPPPGALSWVPDKFWWWWRASRVVQDYDLANAPREIIDEFPFFSYLLADLHPHVLAMPFAILAMGLALNLFLGGADGHLDWVRARLNLRTVIWAGVLSLMGGFIFLYMGGQVFSVRTILVGLAAFSVGWFIIFRNGEALSKYGVAVLLRSDLEEVEAGVPLNLNLPSFLLASIVLGGMAFLNTWDFPVYVAMFSAAYFLYRWPQTGLSKGAIGEFVLLGASLGVTGIVFYLPFYLGFSSQAGGILPNLIYPTRGAHLWVMFGTLLIPILAFLIRQTLKNQSQKSMLGKGFLAAGGLILGLWLFSLLLGFVIVSLPNIGNQYLGSIAASSIEGAFGAAFQRRLANSGGWITLLALLGFGFTAIFSYLQASIRNDGRDVENENPAGAIESQRRSMSGGQAHIFALLLILLGALLVVGPEFFFLRDQFGWRMNTIFKFYFQAWLLWSMAAAYGSVILLQDRRWSIPFQAILLFVLAAGLIYPAFGLWNKTNGFKTDGGWTLDSSAYYTSQAPGEVNAVSWLKAAPQGVVAEAVADNGGSYSTYARISTLSGKPAVLGWIGHESQWRGGGEEMGSRQADIAQLYCSRSWDEAQLILQKYQIRYVFIGSLERSTYQAGSTYCSAGLYEVKFDRYLTPAYQDGEVVIYTTSFQSSSDR